MNERIGTVSIVDSSDETVAIHLLRVQREASVDMDDFSRLTPFQMGFVCTTTSTILLRAVACTIWNTRTRERERERARSFWANNWKFTRTARTHDLQSIHTKKTNSNAYACIKWVVKDGSAGGKTTKPTGKQNIFFGSKLKPIATVAAVASNNG